MIISKNMDGSINHFPYPELLNAKFFFGGSDDYYLDCLGLVIYTLRDKGLSCDWEVDIPRRVTTLETNKEFLRKYGFKKIDYSDVCTEYYDFLVVLFTTKNDEQFGHLGVKFDYPCFYHMTYRGIVESKEQEFYNMSYWKLEVSS
jgi:hypothetical protein